MGKSKMLNGENVKDDKFYKLMGFSEEVIKRKKHEAVMTDLYWFFYYHQYDDKYEHFRCADVVKEYDYDWEGGERVVGRIVVFYDNDPIRKLALKDKFREN